MAHAAGSTQSPSRQNIPRLAYHSIYYCPFGTRTREKQITYWNNYSPTVLPIIHDIMSKPHQMRQANLSNKLGALKLSPLDRSVWSRCKKAFLGAKATVATMSGSPRFKVKEAPVVLKVSISCYLGENITGHTGVEILERTCAPGSLRIVSATFGICRGTID